MHTHIKYTTASNTRKYVQTQKDLLSLYKTNFNMLMIQFTILLLLVTVINNLHPGNPGNAMVVVSLRKHHNV